MTYFKVFSSNLPVEIVKNTTINFIQGSHPAKIRTGHFSNTGPGYVILAVQ
jgi:hypothetical protein